MRPWNVDLTGDTRETIDDLRAGPGWHQAVLHAVEEDDKTMALKLKFRIISPPFVGAHVEQTLFHPEMAETEEKMASAAKKAKLWFGRLGLISDDKLGKQAQLDPATAVGKNFVLHLETQTYTNRKGSDTTGNFPSYAGVYPYDHAGIPPAERVRMGMALLPGQVVNVDGTAQAPAKPGRAKKGAAKDAGEGDSGPARPPIDVSDI